MRTGVLLSVDSGDVDFAELKNHVDFVILTLGCGDYKDERLSEYAQQARKHRIRVAACLYHTQAGCIDEVEDEVAFVTNTVLAEIPKRQLTVYFERNEDIISRIRYTVRPMLIKRALACETSRMVKIGKYITPATADFDIGSTKMGRPFWLNKDIKNDNWIFKDGEFAEIPGVQYPSKIVYENDLFESNSLKAAFNYLASVESE